MSAPKKLIASRKPRVLPQWFNELEWTSGRNPQLRTTLMNAVLVLSNDDEWEGVLGWNLHTQRIEKLLPPPCPAALAPQGGTIVGPFDEDDTVRTAGWFESHPEYRVRFSEENIYKAARVVALRRAYHPLRASLDRWAIAWDRVHRIDTWLSDLLGAEDTPYTRLVGRFFLLGAVARVYNPGCKVDHIVVFEGAQGRRKSGVAEVLFEKYFSDTSLDLNNKDTYLTIRNKWCVELAELDSLSKAEATRIKAFFSSRCDLYREPYAKHPIEVKRSCVFVGTTNFEQYLKDPTGGRRFFPVKIPADIDLVAVAALREQLWGEAAAIYQSGNARWWPEGDEKLLFAHEAEDRLIEDGWTTPISNWLEKQLERTHVENLRIDTHRIVNEAIGKETQHITHHDVTRVGMIMHALHWSLRRPRTDNPTRRRFYFPPESASSVQAIQPGPTAVQAEENAIDEHRSSAVQQVQPTASSSRAGAHARTHETQLDHSDRKKEKNSLRARSIQANDNKQSSKESERLVILQRFLSEACAVGGSETLRVFAEAFDLWATCEGIKPFAASLLPSLLEAMKVSVRDDCVHGLHILDERVAPLGGGREGT